MTGLGDCVRAMCTPAPLRTLELPVFVTPTLWWTLWGPQ